MKTCVLLSGILLTTSLLHAQQRVEMPVHACLLPGMRVLPHVSPPPAPLAGQPLRVYSFAQLSALGEDYAEAGQDTTAGEWLWSPCCVWCLRSCTGGDASCHANACQVTWQWRYADATPQSPHPEAFTRIPLAENFSPLQPRHDPVVIRSDAEWEAIFPRDSLHLRPDFRYAVVLFTEIFADCHATFSPGVTRIPAEKRLRWYVDETYGGCRGMRSLPLAFVIPRPPQDWTLEFVEH